MIYGYIYKTINLINNKIYIGKTTKLKMKEIKKGNTFKKDYLQKRINYV